MEDNIFNTYRTLSEGPGIPTSGEKPTRDMYEIADRVSKVANLSKDKAVHELAHDIHANIANAHYHGGYGGAHWSDLKLENKHRKLAAHHAKFMK